MSQHCKVNALHVLGQLAGQTAAARSAAVVSAIEDAIEQAAAEITQFTASICGEELASLASHQGWDVAGFAQNVDGEYMYVVERRRTIVAGVEAMGLIGNAAVTDAAELSSLMQCARTICRWICTEEPGLVFPSFLSRNKVQHGAGTALVRLCSDPSMLRGSVPVRHGARDAAGTDLSSWDKFGQEVLAGIVAEAVERLRVLARLEPGLRSRRELLVLLEGVAWPWRLPQVSTFLALR